MSDVEFEADIQDANGVNHYTPRSGIIPGQGAGQYNGTPVTTTNVGMVRWLIQHGFIRGEDGARALLIGFVLVNFIATGLILYFYVFR